MNRAPLFGPKMLLPARLALAGILAWIVACAGAADSLRAEAAESTVILISLDGTRPADVTPESMPNLVRFAARGLRAERLIPSFPSNTFPNHVTLVTGVAPDRHGLVDNVFIDPERGSFERRDIPTWIEVEPLWSQLEGRGIVTAAYYWVGSEGEWPGGHAPHYWHPFSSHTAEAEKVEQILAWLDLPEPVRPRFITSWFHGADHAGHLHGPGSPEALRSLAVQDRAIATLIEGLDARNAWPTTTLVFVSDHGMMTAERHIDLGSALRAKGLSAQVLGIGGFASVHLAGTASPSEVVAVARELGLAAWARGDAPTWLQITHRRFGDVVVVAPTRSAIIYEGLELIGFHGYPPDTPEMSAILIAAGRGVTAGGGLASIRNVDVAPTVLSLLGVPVPAWMDGSPIRELVPPAAGALAPARAMPESP